MRKLPPIAAFSHAINSTFNNIGFAFYISWPWLLIVGPLNTLLKIMTWQLQPGDNEGLSSVLGVALLVLLLSMLANSSIAVNWHRYVLLDEIPTGVQRLRLDSTVWYYFGNVFAIVLIVGLFIAVLFFAFMMTFGSFIFTIRLFFFEKASFLVWLAILILLAGGVFISVYLTVASQRLSVKLPAVALQEQYFTFSDAWYVTRGNFWRILGFLTLVALVGAAMFAVSLLLSYVMSDLGAAGIVVAVALSIFVNWILVILGVTVLTSLYGFFVENRDF